MTDHIATEFAVRNPAGVVLDPTHHRSEAEQRLDRYRDMWPTAELVARVTAQGEWVPASEEPPMPVHLPRRGDAVEAWLKAQRDAAADYPAQWQTMDGLLDLYRLHADTRTPLDQHACENGNADDCHGGA